MQQNGLTTETFLEIILSIPLEVDTLDPSFEFS